MVGCYIIANLKYKLTFKILVRSLSLRNGLDIRSTLNGYTRRFIYRCGKLYKIIVYSEALRENYPQCIIVGPSDTDPNAMSVDAWGNPHPWAGEGSMDTAGIAAVTEVGNTLILTPCGYRLYGPDD